ncbi:MAG: hypothetical protein IPK33_08055 [Gemmatimonadetes bacterium]|nr:hypothetical protein [Gemmatimonadota bacterium]
MRTLAYLAVLLLGAVAVMYMVGRSPPGGLGAGGGRAGAVAVWRLIGGGGGGGGAAAGGE